MCVRVCVFVCPWLANVSRRNFFFFFRYAFRSFVRAGLLSLSRPRLVALAVRRTSTGRNVVQDMGSSGPSCAR